MESWKKGFSEILDINKVMQQYEVTLANYKKYIDDIERKNKALHKCTYTAHKALNDWIEAYCTTKYTQEQLLQAMKDLKTTMEETIENGNNESTVPTLYSPSFAEKERLK